MLWFDVTRERFFSIPEDTSVAEGDFELHSFRGGRMQVDPDALAPLEISRDDAAALIDADVQSSWTKARGALQDAFQFGRKAAADVGAPVGEDAPPNPLPENLSEALGVSWGQLQTDPDLVKEKVGQMMDRLKGALQDVRDQVAARDEAPEPTPAPDPESPSLSEVHAQASQTASDAFSEAGRRFAAALNDPKVTGALRNVSEKLAELADRLEAPDPAPQSTADPEPPEN